MYDKTWVQLSRLVIFVVYIDQRTLKARIKIYTMKIEYVQYIVTQYCNLYISQWPQTY